MILEEFIKQTLLDITNGVHRAKQDSPLGIAPGFVQGEAITSPQYVKFEVAITNSNSGGADIGITVVPLGIKGEAKSENLNRISFEVPVYFNAPNPYNPFGTK